MIYKFLKHFQKVVVNKVKVVGSYYTIFSSEKSLHY